MSSANCLIDLKEPRSRILTSTALLPVLDTISVQAASALSLFLQARITLAPDREPLTTIAMSQVAIQG